MAVFEIKAAAEKAISAICPPVNKMKKAHINKDTKKFKAVKIVSFFNSVVLSDINLPFSPIIRIGLLTLNIFFLRRIT